MGQWTVKQTNLFLILTAKYIWPPWKLSFFTVLKIIHGKVLQFSNKAFLFTHVLTSSLNLPFNSPFLNVNSNKILQGFNSGTQLIRVE